MPREKITRRQKDVSRLLRERKKVRPIPTRKSKKKGVPGASAKGFKMKHERLCMTFARMEG